MTLNHDTSIRHISIITCLHTCFIVEAVTLLISYRYIDQLAMLYRIADHIDGLSHVKCKQVYCMVILCEDHYRILAMVVT